MDYQNTKVPHALGPFDDKGIPLFDLRNVRLNGQPTYHPIVIIQHGLAHYNMFVEGVPGMYCVFEKCVRWLKNNAVKDPVRGFISWPYCFSLRTPPATSPWISGMAQGQALSLLMRSYEQTGCPKTADLARQAALCFLYTVSDGGVMSQLPNGGLFIEEVAALPSIHILNGCLYGVIGLVEYLSLLRDPEVEMILGRCIYGVEHVLPAFDIGYWSRYSLGIRWHIAPIHYHDVHIKQLRYLGEHFDNLAFLERARIWDEYASSRRNRLIQSATRLLQVNVNRALTILGANSIKYKKDELNKVREGERQ